MEIDQNERSENLQDDKVDQNVGRNFHNLTHHPAMVRFAVLIFTKIKKLNSYFQNTFY